MSKLSAMLSISERERFLVTIDIASVAVEAIAAVAETCRTTQAVGPGVWQEAAVVIGAAASVRASVRGNRYFGRRGVGRVYARKWIAFQSKNVSWA